MSKAPAMPMYWDAYLADTTHLTTEEHGAYMLLLAAMWRRNGWVPDDDRDNARILGLTKAKWRRIKARLSGFLIFDGGNISQKKLLETWKKTQEKIEVNRENGAKGGRPKKNENNHLAKPNGSVSDKRNETIPEPEPYNTLTNVSDGQAVDFTKEVFDRGVAFLGKYGTPEKSARSLIGKWRKQSGDTETFNALRDASKEGVTEPVSWITARLSRSGSQPDLDALFANIKEGASK